MPILDDISKPVWVAAMVIGFVWFWPVGLTILAYLVWTGRLGGWVAIKPWKPQFWGSGNVAFDEHKADVLKRLQQEQTDFGNYIEDLKKAKDKSEFDQFLAKRKAKR